MRCPYCYYDGLGDTRVFNFLTGCEVCERVPWFSPVRWFQILCRPVARIRAWRLQRRHDKVWKDALAWKRKNNFRSSHEAGSSGYEGENNRCERRE